MEDYVFSLTIGRLHMNERLVTDRSLGVQTGIHVLVDNYGFLLTLAISSQHSNVEVAKVPGRCEWSSICH